MKLHSLLVLFLLFNFHSLFSQKKFKRFNYVDGLSVIPILGVGSVTGELGDVFHFKPVYGIAVEKGFSEKVNLNLEILGGVMNGVDNDIYNAKFQSDYFQVQFYPSLNLTRLYYEKMKRFEIKTYLGIGLIWFHSNVYDVNTGVFLRTTSDGTTKHTALFQQAGVGIGEKGIYYTRELIIPMGCNFKYDLTEKFSLTANLGYNYIYNDKFDATTPYNLTNPTIIGGENSYSNTANDGWLRFSLGIKYIISSFISENQRGV
ncbi:hypothetical protein LV89_00640 [Arcicella aurantiaca]|uniref:Outer membrane protein with beta-barrel domain n=1 Tax=Arcicella aurantiaca TaxID=591202 RepID=A0A316F0J2_9BACT|nr:hypothetical protein [Arcicella aurantiaca]PWK29086.1 hypothetical protein LV89_00640 [Arcicella aurantiaca]